MRALLFGAVVGMLLWSAAPASAKVCYRCSGDRPVKYVCAARDTFRARRNARRLGCQWTSYTSTCNCGAWVAHKSVPFPRIAEALLGGLRPR